MDITSFILGYKKGIASGSGGGTLSPGVYWAQEVPTPTAYQGSHFVYNGDLYYWTCTMSSGSSSRMYKYENGAYKLLFNFESYLTQSAVIVFELNGTLHAFCDYSSYHYTVDLENSTVTRMATAETGTYFKWNGAIYNAKYNALYKYDPTTDTWATSTDITNHKDGASFEHNDDVYIISSKKLYKIVDGVCTEVATFSVSPGRVAVFGNDLYYVHSQYKLNRHNLVDHTDTQIGTIPYLSTLNLYVYDGKVLIHGNANWRPNLSMHVIEATE